MPNGLKMILVVIASLIAGGITLAIIEAIGHALFNHNIAFIFAALGLGIAGFVGGAIAVVLSKRREPAYVVGALLAGLSLINVFSFSHPIWFVPVAFALLAIGVWIAGSRFRNLGA
ncbi:MAG: hypothetical protein ABJO36_07965 [Litorimonas sp.]